tara:strand:- start:1181 stop:1765 length:585 start_codon:yes stop_codon:yes gene_type:complete
MPFEIKNFTSNLSGGGARAGLFEVEINTPSIVTNSATRVQDKFKFTCSATTIPPGTIEVAEVSYMGRLFKLPGGRVFDEWTTTVLNDEDFLVRDSIEQWMDELNGNSTNDTNPGAMSSTTAMQDIIVTQYSKRGDAIRKYVLVDCWPSAVGEITLDWAESSTIQTFDITWNFQWWESKATDDNTSNNMNVGVGR